MNPREVVCAVEWTPPDIRTSGAMQFRVKKVDLKNSPGISGLIQYSTEDRWRELGKLQFNIIMSNSPQNWWVMS